MSDKYILDDVGNPVPCPDLLTWARWFETANADSRRVAKTTLGDGNVEVSTVFLGLDHQYGDGAPLLYETLVFGGPLDDEQERCSTRSEALAMHTRMVARCLEVIP